MRASAWALAMLIWLAPVVQVVAGTLTGSHCGAQGHSSLNAGHAAHESMHSHHQHAGTENGKHRAGAASGSHDHSHCTCPCILACASAAALLPTLPAVMVAAPERPPAILRGLHAHVFHSVPQRPPASSELIA